MILYIGNDNLIRVDRLRSVASGGGFVNDATVTAKVYVDGVQVGDTVTCSYVSASDGRYEGIVDSAVALTAGSATVEVDVDAGAREAHWEIAATVMDRIS